MKTRTQPRYDGKDAHRRRVVLYKLPSFVECGSCLQSPVYRARHQRTTVGSKMLDETHGPERINGVPAKKKEIEYWKETQVKLTRALKLKILHPNYSATRPKSELRNRRSSAPRLFTFWNTYIFMPSVQHGVRNTRPRSCRRYRTYEVRILYQSERRRGRCPEGCYNRSYRFSMDGRLFRAAIRKKTSVHTKNTTNEYAKNR